MAVLVVNHDRFSLPGIVGERLEHHGFELEDLVVVHDIAHPTSDVEFPDPRDYELILPMGSPWSVYDTATIGSWIDRELDLLRAAVTHDVPVLGICFGGQALAAALGATVERAPGHEIGWFDIEPAVDWIAPGPWFQWHFDRFAVPDGATPLAQGPLGPQAYRIGRHLGLQFHPEITADLLGQWLGVADEAELRHLEVAPDHLLELTAEQERRSRPHTEALVDHYLTDVAGLR